MTHSISDRSLKNFTLPALKTANPVIGLRDLLRAFQKWPLCRLEASVPRGGSEPDEGVPGEERDEEVPIWVCICLCLAGSHEKAPVDEDLHSKRFIILSILKLSTPTHLMIDVIIPILQHHNEL